MQSPCPRVNFLYFLVFKLSFCSVSVICSMRIKRDKNCGVVLASFQGAEPQTVSAKHTADKRRHTVPHTLDAALPPFLPSRADPSFRISLVAPERGCLCRAPLEDRDLAQAPAQLGAPLERDELGEACENLRWRAATNARHRCENQTLRARNGVSECNLSIVHLV